MQTVLSNKQLTRQLQEAWSQISPDVLYTGVRHTGRHLLCMYVLYVCIYILEQSTHGVAITAQSLGQVRDMREQVGTHTISQTHNS